MRVDFDSIPLITELFYSLFIALNTNASLGPRLYYKYLSFWNLNCYVLAKDIFNILFSEF